jgi:hypothetical protein
VGARIAPPGNDQEVREKLSLEMDWSSFRSAVIGAAAALLGVLFTQWFERKKAHEDRVWATRSQTYTQLYRWTEVAVIQTLNIIEATKSPGSIVVSMLPDSEYFGAENEVALAVFASKDVFEQYQEANSDRLAALRTFHAWQAKRPKEAANVPSEVPDDIAEAVKKTQISISRPAQKIRRRQLAPEWCASMLFGRASNVFSDSAYRNCQLFCSNMF